MESLLGQRLALATLDVVVDHQKVSKSILLGIVFLFLFLFFEFQLPLPPLGESLSALTLLPLSLASSSIIILHRHRTALRGPLSLKKGGGGSSSWRILGNEKGSRRWTRCCSTFLPGDHTPWSSISWAGRR